MGEHARGVNARRDSDARRATPHPAYHRPLRESNRSFASELLPAQLWAERRVAQQDPGDFFPRVPRSPAHQVDRSVFWGCHEPRAETPGTPEEGHCRSAISRATAGGDPQSLTDLSHPVGAQTRDAIGAQRHPDGRHVIEAQGALSRHSVRGVKRHFRGDSTNDTGRRDCEHLVEDGKDFVPGQDQERPATRAWVLVPPHFTTTYQGSWPAARSSASSR
jgi:hypothetical protein